MSKAALPEDSDEERERKERERRSTLGKLYPLAPPRWLPPILDTEEYGAGSSDYVLGVHTYEDGSVYAGEWRRGMRSGWGVYESAKPKVKYSGEWRTNRYDGLGIVTYPTGNRYEGEFLADQRHGRGLFLWKTTGEIYYGCWEQDVRSGLGCHHWPDGAKYEGEWAYGVPHGRGRYIWSDGRRYEGIFTMGRRGGPPPTTPGETDDKRLGVATAANGKKFKGGCWEDGQCVREVRLILEKNTQNKTLHPVGKIGNLLVQVQLLCEDARLMAVTTPLYAMNAKKASAVGETRAAQALELKRGKQVHKIVMKPSKAAEDAARQVAAAAAAAKEKAAAEAEKHTRAAAQRLVKSGNLVFDPVDSEDGQAEQQGAPSSEGDSDGDSFVEQDSVLADSLFDEEEHEEEEEEDSEAYADKDTDSGGERRDAGSQDSDDSVSASDDNESGRDSPHSLRSMRGRTSYFDRHPSSRELSFRSERGILPTAESSLGRSRGVQLAEYSAATDSMLAFLDLQTPGQQTAFARSHAAVSRR